MNLTAAAVDSIAHLVGRNHFPSKRAYEGRGHQRHRERKFVRYVTHVAYALRQGARSDDMGVWSVAVCLASPLMV